MQELKIIATVGKIAIKVFNKMDQIFVDVNKNNLIINSIERSIFDVTMTKVNKKDIKTNLKRVYAEYDHLNKKKYIPDIKSLLMHTIELTIVDNEITLNEEQIKELEKNCNQIMDIVFDYDSKIHDEYLETSKSNMLLIDIPKKLIEIEENLSFKTKLMTLEQKISSINSKKKKNVEHIDIDFYDYEDIEFETELLKEIKNERFLYISGPTSEEAMLYSLFILKKNNIENVYIVDSKEVWKELRAISGLDKYKNVIFIADIKGYTEIEPIPYCTNIILLDNEISISTDEVIKFEKRKKDITQKKLEKILPMREIGEVESNKYSSNDIHKEIESRLNEYSSYKKLMFNEVINYDLSVEEIIITLVGSFSIIEKSKDVVIIKNYFSEYVNMTQMNIERYRLNIVKHDMNYNVIDKEEIIRNLIDKHKISNQILNSYIKYASEVLVEFINERYSNEFFIRDINNVSNKCYEGVLSTIKLISKYWNNSNLVELIYKRTISNLTDEIDKGLAKILLFNDVLIYKIDLLIVEIQKLISSDDIKIINKEKKINPFDHGYYSTYLVNLLKKMLYSEIYSLEVIPLILKTLDILDDEREKRNCKEILEIYFSYIANDFPVNDNEKLEFISSNEKYGDKILEIIINTEYSPRTYMVNDLEMRLGFSRIKRDRFQKERYDYTIEIQKMYFDKVEEINLVSFIDDFNLYHLHTENSVLLTQFENKTFSDHTILEAIMKLRSDLNWGIKHEKNQEINLNGHEFLDKLENELQNKDLKYVYVLVDTIFSSKLTLNDCLKEEIINEEIGIIEKKKMEILQLNTESIREILKYYFSLKSEWVHNFDFIITCMEKIGISFEEGLEMLITNGKSNNNQIVTLISYYERFKISFDKLYTVVSNLCNNNILKNEIGYYFQHIIFSMDCIINIEENDKISILKYINVYQIEENNQMQYYEILKSNGLVDKCVQMLNDRLNKFSILSNLNIIEETLYILNIKNNGFKVRSDDIEELYNLCLKKYFYNKSEENKDKMNYLSFYLISIIKDYSFFKDEIINNDKYLIDCLFHIVFPKDSEIETIKKYENIRIPLRLMLDEIDMNDKELKGLSEWIYNINKKYNNSDYHEEFVRFVGSISGKYFAIDEEIINLINSSFLRNIEFQRSFIISYSNTIGVTSSGINEVPKVYINRKNQLVKLLDKYHSEPIKKNLIQHLIDDNNRSINHFESFGRN